MTDEPPSIRRSWVLVAPAIAPEDEQRRPGLYWSGDAEGWVESPGEASAFSDAGRAAFDLSAFNGHVEWWVRQAS